MVYILRERGQIIYLFIYLFTCVLEGNKKKTKGVVRKEKEEKENKRSGTDLWISIGTLSQRIFATLGNSAEVQHLSGWF